MTSLHSLALFCAICFASLGWAQSTFVSENMRKEIDVVKGDFNDFYKENRPKWHGKPLFLKTLDTLEEGEKNLLVGEMLRMSETVLNNLLNRTRNVTAGMAIVALVERVSKLQKNKIPTMTPDLRTRLQALWGTKVDDLQTQLQAVSELAELYSRAEHLSRTAGKIKKRRRRRQVLRCKIPQLL